jgi:hypothetical protein
MAGATAFFTTFALPPILVILIQVLKLVLDPKLVRNELFNSLSSIIGEESVEPIRNILRALRGLAQNWWIIIGGFIFLLFVATTLFRVIKSSVNHRDPRREDAQDGWDLRRREDRRGAHRAGADADGVLAAGPRRAGA